MNIELPEGMHLGLILPIGLINLNYTEYWLGEWVPLDRLLEEVDWPQLFDQLGISPDFIDQDTEEIDLEGLKTELPGIILRLDLGLYNSNADSPHFGWKHFYGYCGSFKEIEKTLQGMIAKASEDKK